MSEVIYVDFDTECRWRQIRVLTVRQVVAVGALFGDDEALMRAKAECAYQVVRQMVEDVPPMRVTATVPVELSARHRLWLHANMEDSFKKGIRSAVHHSVHTLMKSLSDLCTSRLAATSAHYVAGHADTQGPRPGESRRSKVIQVAFGMQREWHQMRAEMIDNLIAVGSLFGDDETLMRAKAQCACDILRQMVADMPAVPVISGMPDNLSFEHLQSLKKIISDTFLKGVEAATVHAIQTLTVYICDLCTSLLIANTKNRP